jgi:hypothetical protein
MVTKRPHSKLEGTTGVGAGSPWAQSSKDFVNSHNTIKDNAIHPNNDCVNRCTLDLCSDN